MIETLIMNKLAIETYSEFTDTDCEIKISELRRQLGKKILILAHHYQRADVYKHADYHGDSYKLAKYASTLNVENIIFCGVHFMAEVADILTDKNQKVILPDLSAGCSMADMANLSKVNRCWKELSSYLNVKDEITPITYINSAADLKSFCGKNDGIVCTSSNASKVLDWAFKNKNKVLFFPDQHLGRWTGTEMGIDRKYMEVWDPDLENGGLDRTQIQNTKIFLWKGHCSVHQMFQPQHILKFRNKYPDGYVISHPECSYEVCKMSDYVGSTEFIIEQIRESKPNTKWLVGTELNLVNRIAKEFKKDGKLIQFMSPLFCMCSTMNRIDPQHLAWSLENLLNNKIVNQISVPSEDREFSKLALGRMLDIS